MKIANLTPFARRRKEKGLATFPPLRFVAPDGAAAVVSISVNFSDNNRFIPRSGRFGFLTEPDFEQKPWILQTSLESRRDGICVEKRDLTDLSPVGAASIKTFLQNTVKNP